MALKLEQQIKLAQQLIMSPQMQQAIKILQLPLMELRATIQEEMNINPVLEENLERDEPVDSNIEEIALKAEEKVPDPTEETFKEEFEKLKKLDEEWREYYHQTYAVKKFTAVDEEKRRFFQELKEQLVAKDRLSSFSITHNIFNYT